MRHVFLEFAGWSPLAYAGYLVWLAAGFADFACHRHSHLPETSGLRESNLHLVQIALVGGGVSLFLAMHPGLGLLAACVVLACVHATFGYLDTRSAYELRPITPVEQHVHSILDMAPWIAIGMLGVIVASGNWQDGWGLQWRHQPLDASIWFAVLFPAFAMVILPALKERVACRRARSRLSRRTTRR